MVKAYINQDIDPDLYSWFYIVIQQDNLLILLRICTFQFKLRCNNTLRTFATVLQSFRRKSLKIKS